MQERDLPDLSAMSYTGMTGLAESFGLAVFPVSLTGNVKGIYDDSMRTILIDGRMPDVSKRCTLAHELVHWIHGDCCCDGLIGARMETRCRRETARRLIPLTEYATAERMYDGDRFRMGADLNVTVQVVNDYAELVIPGLPVFSRIE